MKQRLLVPASRSTGDERGREHLVTDRMLRCGIRGEQAQNA